MCYLMLRMLFDVWRFCAVQMYHIRPHQTSMCYLMLFDVIWCITFLWTSGRGAPNLKVYTVLFMRYLMLFDVWRFCAVQMYRIRPRRTKPQGLLFMCYLVLFDVICCMTFLCRTDVPHPSAAHQTSGSPVHVLFDVICCMTFLCRTDEPYPSASHQASGSPVHVLFDVIWCYLLYDVFVPYRCTVSGRGAPSLRVSCSCVIWCYLMLFDVWRFCAVQMYRIRPRCTKPQGLLFMCYLVLFDVICCMTFLCRTDVPYPAAAHQASGSPVHVLFDVIWCMTFLCRTDVPHPAATHQASGSPVHVLFDVIWCYLLYDVFVPYRCTVSGRGAPSLRVSCSCAVCWCLSSWRWTLCCTSSPHSTPRLAANITR